MSSTYHPVMNDDLFQQEEQQQEEEGYLYINDVHKAFTYMLYSNCAHFSTFQTYIYIILLIISMK